MAYDSDISSVTSELTNSNSTVFSESTINQILALTTKDNDTVRIDTVAPDVNGNVTVAAGAEVVLISGSDTSQTKITPPANAPVVIFQGKGGVAVNFNDGNATVPGSAPGTADRVIVGSAGNDNIVVSDSKNSQIILGTGNSTVAGGAGSDTIVAGLGNSTISGGGGYDVVQMGGENASNLIVSDDGSTIIVTVSHSRFGNSAQEGEPQAVDGARLQISGINYVKLDNNKALVFAKDAMQAGVTALYEATFGRTGDANGLNYWFEKAAAGQTLSDIAKQFAASAEFNAVAAKSNADFVASLYQQTFGRAADAAGAAYWNEQLAAGMSRVDLITTFSNVAALNIAGTIDTEVDMVGVYIVPGIV